MTDDERVKSESDGAGESGGEGGEGVVCPNCMEANEERAYFCAKCGAPLSATSTMDPMLAIQSGGWAARQVASGERASGIVLWGCWILLTPLVLAVVAGAVLECVHGRKMPLLQVIGVSVRLALASLYLAILWRATERHIRARRERCGAAERMGDSDEWAPEEPAADGAGSGTGIEEVAGPRMSTCAWLSRVAGFVSLCAAMGALAGGATVLVLAWPVCAVLGLGLGIDAVGNIRASRGELIGLGAAITGICLSAVGLALLIVMIFVTIV